MSGTPFQIVQDYVTALMEADVSKLLDCYSDDAILLSVDGSFVGKPALERFHRVAAKNLNGLTVSVDRIVAQGEIILFHWYGEAQRVVISHSVDSFVVVDDRIHRHTTWHQVGAK